MGFNYIGIKMNIRGEFTLITSIGKTIILPNTITAVGAEALLKHDFQNVTLNNFYLGLCDQSPAHSDALVDITTEPGSAGGYARKLLTRNGTDWPTVVTDANQETRVESKDVTWNAAAADFDTAFSRIFLCDIISGTAGILFAYSAPLSAAITLLDGNSFPVKYKFYIS